MRIAFMGTPFFAKEILKGLIEASYEVIGVYTQPPRPMGRGYQVTPSPVHVFADLHHIPVFTPPSLKDKSVQKAWETLAPDVAIVAAYGLILPKIILDVPLLGCLNVHGSLLPRWRGAAPLQRAILAGDQETGITLMKMEEGLDTGPILLEERIPLDQTMTTPRLLETLTQLGVKTLLKALPLYQSGHLTPAPQPLEGITYADKVRKEEGRLDWRLSAALLDRKIRALNPWPGTWFDVGEDQIKVLDSLVMPSFSSLPPGTVLDDRFTIQCGEGALRVLRVQKKGKAPLETAEFLRGYALPPRLGVHETL